METRDPLRVTVSFWLHKKLENRLSDLPWPKIRSEDKEDWAKVWRQLKDIQAHQVQLGLIVLERKLKNNVRKRKNYKAREQNGKKEKRDDK